MDPIHPIEGMANVALDAMRALLEPPAGASDIAPSAAIATGEPTAVPIGTSPAFSEVSPLLDAMVRDTAQVATMSRWMPNVPAALPAATPEAAPTRPSPQASTEAPSPPEPKAAQLASQSASAAPRAAPAGVPSGSAVQEAASHAAPHALQAATQPASQLIDSVALPVLVSSLRLAPADLRRPAHLPQSTRRPVRRRGEREGEECEPDEHDASSEQEVEETATPSRAAEPEIVARERTADAGDDRWVTLLCQAGQPAAARELRLGRRVLIIEAYPQSGRGACVYLLCRDALGSRQLRRFDAAWRDGAGSAPALPWKRWRLHRETASDSAPQWRTRPGQGTHDDGAPCLLRLGPQPAPACDPAGACLDVPDRYRFQRAMGKQWSLLALLAPADWMSSR